VGGEDDHRQMGVEEQQPFEQVDAVHPIQFEVDDGHIVDLVLRQPERLFAPLRCGRFVAC
jgi:hypothetical protein